MPIVIPFILIAAGIATFFVAASTSDDHDVPDHPPDVPQPMPGSTGYKLVDKILPQLMLASASSGVPLGLLVGWIAKESGGKIGEVTKYGEKGLFQLMPAESAKLGLDHDRLSTDVTYSINGGLALIASYMKDALNFGVAPQGTDFFWILDKLCHTVGTSAAKKWIDAAKSAHAVGSWNEFAQYCTDNSDALLSSSKHAPKKWIPFLQQILTIGKPFGFGSQFSTQQAVAGFAIGDLGPVAGGTIFPDIVDPLDLLS